MNIKRKISEFIKDKENRVLAVAVLLLAYSVFKIFSAFSLFSILTNKGIILILYALVPYIMIILVCIKTMKGKKLGWYGLSTLGMLLILNLALLLFSLVFVYGFKNPIPQIKIVNLSSVLLSPKLYIQIVLGIVGVFLVKLLVSKEIVESFNIKIRNGLLRIILIILISISVVLIYFGLSLLLMSGLGF